MTTYNNNDVQERTLKRDNDARHRRKMTQGVTMTRRDDIRGCRTTTTQDDDVTDDVDA